MFASNGKYLLRAAKEDNGKVAACIAEAREKDFPNIIGKIVAEVGLRNDQRELVYDALINDRDLKIFEIVFKADQYIGLNDTYLNILRKLEASGWQEGLECALGHRRYGGDNDVFNFLGKVESEELHNRLRQKYTSTSAMDLVWCATRLDVTRLARYLDQVDNVHANTLSKVAHQVLENGHSDDLTVQVIEDLLGRGMNVNYSDGVVMQGVLQKGLIDLAKRMLDEGFEPDLMRTHIYRKLCENGAPRASLDFVKQIRGVVTSIDASESGFSQSDEYSVSCVQALPGSGRLTMLFNFATGQQIIVAQMGEQIAPPTVVPFSQIENRNLLAKAADAYVTGGGDAELVASIMSTPRKPVVSKTATGP